MKKTIKCVFIDDLKKQLTPTKIADALAIEGRHLEIYFLEDDKPLDEVDVMRPLVEAIHWGDRAEFLAENPKSGFVDYRCVILNSSIYSPILNLKGTDRITGAQFINKISKSFNINVPHVLITHKETVKEGDISPQNYVNNLAGKMVYDEYDSLDAYADSIKPSSAGDSAYPKDTSVFLLNSKNLTKINH